MTFLNPAVLLGLIAASIPIVLHFLNLRRLKKIEFSTLAFLKELQKTKIRKIKLKQWLLLLLRIAIITLLVMAFARPTVKTITLGSSSAAKTTAVFIIDNTFSMSAVTEKGSYFNHAKQIAKSLLNNFQEGDEIVLIPVSESKTIATKPTSNFSELKKQIDDLQISLPGGTVNAAISRTAQILFQSKNFNKEVYLFTDFQKGRLFNSPGDVTNMSRMIGANTRLFVVSFDDKQPVNLGIEDLIPNNQIFEKLKLVSFTARIKNYSDKPVGNSVVSLFVNGKRSAQQSINFSANESRDVTFETTLNDTGLVQFSAELEDDDILQDNKRFFSVYVPDKVSVLLIDENRDDAGFIRLAIENQSDKIKIDEYNSAQLSSLNLNAYDAVIVIGGSQNSAWTDLAAYAEKGGGLILMPGSQTSLEMYQSLCKVLNLALPTAAIGKINSRETVSEFDKVEYQNPMFKDLFEGKQIPKIDSPEIYHYFKIAPAGKGNNIISMADNSSFLSEYKVSIGKVFLFNSAPTLSWNNFPVKAFFAPLMNKLVLASASKIKNESNVLVGEELPVNISNKKYSQIKIVKPNGLTEYVNADSLLNKNYFFYTKTDEVGTYKFYSGKGLLDYFSVNSDPKESVTEHSSDSEFKDYLKQIGFEGKLFNVSPDDDFSKIIYQARFGTELWKYFLVLVLILAVIESLVARSSKKDLINIQQPASSIKDQGSSA